MMRLVGGRRARATVSVGSEVGTALNSALRHQLLLHVAGAFGQRGRIRGKVEHHPVPPAAAGRCVRIIDGDSEAFGPSRRHSPTQSRRDVPAGAAEALKYLFVDDGPALLDVGASQGHALRIRSTRTERTDAKCRNPISKFCHCNSSPYDIRDWMVAPGAGTSNSNFWDCLEAKGAMRRFAGSRQASRTAKDPQVIVGLRRYPLRRPTRNVTHVYGFLARNAVFSPGTASWYASAAASWIRDRAWKKEKSCLAWKICLSAFAWE